MEAKLKLGLGYRFKPTEEELINLFLSKRVRGQLLTPNPILECDLYGKRSPWEIFDEIGNDNKNNINIWYCFTCLKKTSKNRVSRVAGNGTWHGETSAKEIVDSKNKNVIGFKKTFTFKIKREKTDWIMHEFTLADHQESSTYVLCKIKKKKPKEAVEEEDEDEAMASEATTLMNNTAADQAGSSSVSSMSDDVGEPYYYVPDPFEIINNNSEAAKIDQSTDEDLKRDNDLPSVHVMETEATNTIDDDWTDKLEEFLQV